jgi:hypothetical protein
MTERSLWVIRDLVSGAWCTSSKHNQFSMHFEAAAIFNSQQNAEKQVCEIRRQMADPVRWGRVYSWSTDGKPYAIQEREYHEVAEFDPCAVECILKPSK